jgi:betaine-aldehyde dehydrogenase
MRMSGRLDVGCVWINTHIPLVAEMPHGGFKHSGYGKDLSMYGLEDYTRIKHVMANIESRTERVHIEQVGTLRHLVADAR